ncbi:MAG TPA: hypothetical protein VNS88_10050 [Nitrospiraceae bacterium]|nr:hypothetical protein [Nitrospiraceae bacterium]
MNIGEEEETPVEYPEPVAPGKKTVREPSPQVVPVEEPAHAKVSNTERETYARCDRG